MSWQVATNGWINFSDGNARVMTEDKGIVDIVAAMTKHKDSHELFEAGCAVIVGLCLQGLFLL